MTNMILTIAIALAILGIGGVVLWRLLMKRARGLQEAFLKQGHEDVELLKKDKLLEIKEEALRNKAELEKEFGQRQSRLQSLESKLKNREQALSQSQAELQRATKAQEEQQKREEQLLREETKRLERLEQEQKRTLQSEKRELEQQREANRLQEEHLQEKQREAQTLLESIGGLSAEEAKQQLIESMRDEARAMASSYISEVIEEARMTATSEARKIVVKTIQRVATETAIENAVSVFHIENDEMKGRIIGREGRNIRALEAATGVEVIVDDTPEAIVLSCFDPVRREIARLTLHQLVQDGRIHPARIEEVAEKTRISIEEEIIETGKRTVIDLGIHGLHPELIRLVGKMKYRSSYGQNLLQHARETANLCAVMASELGLNPHRAKRAGLLHDIGKVSDEEPELPHALLGMKLCERYKEKPDICNAVGAHHDEIEMETLIAPIVQACDAISGARPGARREIAEAYIKRLNDLEKLALAYPGVIKTYAIQAGRELRVIVGAEKVSDQEAVSLSHDIAQKIQDEMTYPGQVKITVIRETRAVTYAK